MARDKDSTNQIVPNRRQAANHDEKRADLMRSIDHSDLERRLVLIWLALEAQLTNRGMTSVLIGQATAYTDHLAPGRWRLQQPFESADSAIKVAHF
jgi:hypothetical protein